jgi:cellulose synthase/poly-beta-1,6-N-acetylglucosamine synthase-like glycosyltransferase/peptidoglycan/xylan/chitin deacetylase (PgdA/CDA1 family)
MHLSVQPVFFDPTGRRRRWVLALLFGLLIAVTTAGLWVAATLVQRPSLDPSGLPTDLRPAAVDLTRPDAEIAHLQVSFAGQGEILVPRVLEEDDGQPATCEFRRFGGGDPETDPRIVLTFDDGPDPVFTPEILDILQAYRVPAVFFVVGKYAEEHPGLLRRIAAEGHEIGNHSFSHADLYKGSAFQQEMEMAATQRVIQAITGHSTLLFRPPYGGNPEPSVPAEIIPPVRAARAGYITVGEGIIPSDWELTKLRPGVHGARERQRLTPDDIVNRVIRSRHAGHIVLLHDAGGDRRLTVAALPKIITELRARGHAFVSLSELCGLPREALMPLIPPGETRLVAGNRIILAVGQPIQRTLGVLFLLATFFGLARVAFLVVLVLLQWSREKRRQFRADYEPTVTVIMAAYNEEKVIVRSLASLLRADYEKLDIVVVNDGSTDATLDLLRRHFGGHPRLKILDQKNSGKMAAMNRGLADATGEIIVLADADTLFPPAAIGNMVRHFHDERVGAVAAGVRIGNAADNILTRWQALEYSTCQNFDRRGFDLINCIPVIAGAAGAVRRDAILELGGFSPETLNEDMDMTWQLLRGGWRIVNDSEAVAYTEAPNTLRSFLRQRFRWAYGTFQCLWKHRDAVGRYGAFGWVALPIQWLHQVLLPLLSPVVDVFMIYSLCTGHAGKVALFALLMMATEMVGAVLAVITGGGNPRLLPWLPLQRLGYHPFMWYVVVKAFVSALAGTAVGWNKFARAGTAEIEGDGVTIPAPEKPAEVAAELEMAEPG